MTSTPGLKHLLLHGLGHAHAHVLRGLAQSRPADRQKTREKNAAITYLDYDGSLNDLGR
jgi:hypothetical protein